VGKGKVLGETSFPYSPSSELVSREHPTIDIVEYTIEVLQPGSNLRDLGLVQGQGVVVL
jgi:hypothetical protein